MPPFSVRELDYDLPQELIAQRPADRREDARLLIVNRADAMVRDARITDLPELLSSEDLLVLNDTKVLPAKFLARRASGGAVPGLFLEETGPHEWLVMLQGSHRLKVGESLSITPRAGPVVQLRPIHNAGEGQWRVAVDAPGTVEDILARVGRTPLPPYIRRKGGDLRPNAGGPVEPGATPAGVQPRDDDDDADRLRYQTVYARVPGAVAAPTAGLHFTESLLERVRSAGVSTVCVTLHVGVGTFKPIVVERLADHAMHAERYGLTPAVAEALHQCRSRAGRVVAVGTTSARVLETCALPGDASRAVAPASGNTRLFIYPPYRFRVVDALLTNFHLPRSTLLAMVMAAGGVELIRHAYAHAIAEQYRFYSFGDAMLIV
ncbi:MAG: S-adenosylmethionine:tRNA ribosyltransferase-isomerase [Planctomycetes bacterium]|nr:S-adenosylmethionine:tRNA ribosyltransferase-isomerase [Planctomycetota bacterium]